MHSIGLMIIECWLIVLHRQWRYLLVVVIAPHLIIIICIRCSFTFWISNEVELLIEICHSDVSFNAWELRLHLNIVINFVCLLYSFMNSCIDIPYQLWLVDLQFWSSLLLGVVMLWSLQFAYCCLEVLLLQRVFFLFIP